MNYRKYDIIEINFKAEIVKAEIVDVIHRKRMVCVIIHGSEKKENINGGKGWYYKTYSYDTENIKYEDIVRTIVRKKGKGYKKKYNIKFIDENGNIETND